MPGDLSQTENMVNVEAVVKQEEARLHDLHPTTSDVPGCMKLFDDFLLCHASQVKSLYRYGQMSECSHKLEDFKFCMSTKSMHPEERREAWIRRRAEWWAQRRLTKSSEDVWEVRTEPLANFPPSLSPNIRETGTID